MLLATSVMMALSLAESFSLTSPLPSRGRCSVHSSSHSASSSPSSTCTSSSPGWSFILAAIRPALIFSRIEHKHVAVVHRRPGHVHLGHNRSRTASDLEKLRLVGVRLSLGQTGLHAALLYHYPVRELILEARRLETLNLAVLNRKTAKEVVELHSLDGSHCLLVDTALRANPEVNMLLVGILVKVEIAIALVELALLTFWHCLQLQLFNPPESP